MHLKTKLVTLKSQQFIFHPSGATYWKDEDALLIADVHFGKITHFRKHGSAISQEALYKNFNNLDTVINFFTPKSIYFLGDLFHSSSNSEWDLFVDWTRLQNITLVLISGNHDIISPLRYESIGIKVIDQLILKGFLMTHIPTESDSYFNIAGHIHPGISLKGLGRQHIRLSCFHVKPRQLILPAFGTFTGKFIVKPSENDIIYVIAENEVIEIV